MESGTSAVPGRRGGRPCAPENATLAGLDSSPPWEAAGRALDLETRPRTRTPPGPAPGTAARAMRTDRRIDGQGRGRDRGHAARGGASAQATPWPRPARKWRRAALPLPAGALPGGRPYSSSRPLAPPTSATQAGGGAPPTLPRCEASGRARQGFRRQRPGGAWALSCRSHACSRPEAPCKGHCGEGGGERLQPSLPWLPNLDPGWGVFRLPTVPFAAQPLP